MMIPMINKFYAENEMSRRDEAIRSASLAAMTLMHAAFNMGYATGPMIGFDPKAVGELTNLGPNHLPVMLIVIGKLIGEVRSRGHRYPLETVVRLETMDGKGL